jgi:hypothetical protein
MNEFEEMKWERSAVASNAVTTHRLKKENEMEFMKMKSEQEIAEIRYPNADVEGDGLRICEGIGQGGKRYWLLKEVTEILDDGYEEGAIGVETAHLKEVKELFIRAVGTIHLVNDSAEPNAHLKNFLGRTPISDETYLDVYVQETIDGERALYLYRWEYLGDGQSTLEKAIIRMPLKMLRPVISILNGVFPDESNGFYKPWQDQNTKES